MGKISLGVVFCRNTPEKFKDCPDCSLIRAIGNLSPDFPDEELYIKSCKLISNDLGECEHQCLLNKLPTLPIFFYRDKQ